MTKRDSEKILDYFVAQCHRVEQVIPKIKKISQPRGSHQDLKDGFHCDDEGKCRETKEWLPGELESEN